MENSSDEENAPLTQLKKSIDALKLSNSEAA
jgi:hypothetical protein